MAPSRTSHAAREHRQLERDGDSALGHLGDAVVGSAERHSRRPTKLGQARPTDESHSQLRPPAEAGVECAFVEQAAQSAEAYEAITVEFV